MSKQKKAAPEAAPRPEAPAVETGTMRTGVPPAVSPATQVVTEDEAAMWKKKFQAERAKVLELEAAGVPALLARAEKAEERLALVGVAWGEYVEYLKEKYPPADGKPFEFTCEHHKAIDGLLKD